MRNILGTHGFLAFVSMLFLNAFVDLGHKIVIQNTVFKIFDGELQIILTAIVNGLILLPFVLLFTPAGFLSDKYPKHKVMRYSAWAAVGITLAITLCYYLGLFWPAFGLTFLLAMQSAIYSPAKYGYIKELVGGKHLAQANGIVQAVTIVSMLVGIFSFSMLFENMLVGQNWAQPEHIMQLIAPAGWLLVAGSVMELNLSYRLPQTTETKHTVRFDYSRYIRGDYLRSNFKTIRGNQVIWLSIIGLSIFWSISQVMLAVFPAFAEDVLGQNNTVVIHGLTACSGIGIVIGSLIAGRVSRNYIEIGLIPLGAIGVAGVLALFPGLQNAWTMAVSFIALGTLGGLFIVPLNALIQFHAGEKQLGRVLAGNNLVQNSVMLGFLGLTAAFAFAGADGRVLFVVIAAVGFAGAVYTLYKLPQSLTRLVLDLVVRNRYRLQVLGFKNIPEQDGVLMLGNHASWIDWAIIQVASPRPVRFVMERSIYERWYLKPLLNLFGVIPISKGASKAALEQVTQLLNKGEVVCLFPEGIITRTGHMNEFKRGYERAAENAQGVILPFYLHGLWGSRFARSSDKLKMTRRAGGKLDIVVSFGEQLPMTTKANELKRIVFDLSITSWEQYSQTLPSLPMAWIDSVKRHGKQGIVSDATSGTLTANKALTGAVCFSRLIRRESLEQNIGLLLPPSNAAAIANTAVLLRGKTVVNLNYTASEDALLSAFEQAEIKSVYTSRKFLAKLKARGINLDDALSQCKVLYMEDLKEQIRTPVKLVTLLAIKCLPGFLLRKLFCKKVDVESTAAVLFSSGSEGEPKGVMLSHRNLMANLKQTADVLNIQEADKVMATLPQFHAFGLTVTTFLPLIEGLPVIYHPDPTDVVNVSQLIAKHRATILLGTSTFLRLYNRNRQVEPLTLDSLRLVVAGAEKLNADLRGAFKQKFGKDIYEGFGATETSPVASVNLPDSRDPITGRIHCGAKIGTVGMPLPGTAFRIVDPDTFAALPSGADGHILIAGPQVMTGYLNNDEKTADTVVKIDGQRWYKTGDKGRLDEDGFLTIVDRYSRFAKLGGEMVSLAAVEDQIRLALNQPELELVAVNLPDEKKGERIVALIVSDIEPTQIKKALVQSNCNPLMIPAEIRKINEVPMLGSGKKDFAAAKQLALAPPVLERAA